MNTMTENPQSQHVHNATWEMVHSFYETSQAVVNSVLTLQEHNLKLTQSLFSGWMEPRLPQKESTQSLQWRQQTQRQQETFQSLAAASMRMYMGFLLAPFAFWAPFSSSRKLVDAAATGLEREQERALRRLAFGLQYAYGQSLLPEEITP